ncbi:MAG: outer membrane lipoprotein carrier protein LolA [candidate division Zixibacteria bacterium RBG_16_40_9]|nr:MAG: outer membrane lipoprotein carrier protein LolA [candidate division Zixibacteria bacterium RBG_16_40_9]
MSFTFRNLIITVKSSFKSLVLLFILLSISAFAEETLSHVIQRVEAKYKNLKSLSMVFTKQVKSQNFDRVEKSKGKVWIKNSDKFRLDSDQEKIISDGKTVWIYSKENKQVTKNRKEKVKNIFDFNQHFTDFSNNYASSLKGKDKILNLPCLILELTPKKENEFIAKINLWVELKTSFIRKIEYWDINDNHITLLFNQISPNAKISDKEFSFQLPQGVELVDLTDIK